MTSKFSFTSLAVFTLLGCGGSPESDSVNRNVDGSEEPDAGSGGSTDNSVDSTRGTGGASGENSPGSGGTGGARDMNGTGALSGLGGDAATGGGGTGGGTDACDSVVCDAPPTAICSGDFTLTTYQGEGDCAEGICTYQTSETNCETGCEGGACRGGCLPNKATCESDRVEVCEVDGNFQTLAMKCNGTCIDGLCDEVCAKSQSRCRGTSSQACTKIEGSWVWGPVKECGVECNGRYGVCEYNDLTIRSDIELDDTLIVQGTLTIQAGVTVTVPGGALTIIADNIVIEPGAIINVTPRGGRNWDYCKDSRGYATDSAGGKVAPHHRSSNTVAEKGGAGCRGSFFSGGVTTCGGGSPGLGGGVLRLIGTSSIDVKGVLRVNGGDGKSPFNTRCSAGGGGGGAGGSILLWSPLIVKIGSTIEKSGGRGGTARGTNGRSGEGGLLKEYSGDVRPIWDLQSPSHPSDDIFSYYNDGADSYRFHWNQAAGASSYLIEGVDAPETLPLGATALSLTDNFVTLPSSSLLSVADLSQGSSMVYVNVVAIAEGGEVQAPHATYGVVLNHRAPVVTSSTHSGSSWTDSTSATFDLRNPLSSGPIGHIAEYRYTISDSAISTPLEANSSRVPAVVITPTSRGGVTSIVGLSPGAHMIHAVSIDQFGYPTLAVGRMLFLVGADPGAGTITGTVRDASGAPVQGVTITLNEGLIRGLVPDVQSGLDGTYSLENVPAGEWRVSTADESFAGETQNITLSADSTESAEISGSVTP